MKDKEVVRIVEPCACVESHPDGWLVRSHPEGRIIGGGVTPEEAWRSARMRLFGETIDSILSEIPTAIK